jgi:hypothetical protein
VHGASEKEKTPLAGVFASGAFGALLGFQSLFADPELEKQN